MSTCEADASAVAAEPRTREARCPRPQGPEALAPQLDDLAGHIATPVTVRRGLLDRLHYPPRCDHARSAAGAVGLTVTDRTLRSWLEGRCSPSRKSLDGIERAYRSVRRENVAPLSPGPTQSRRRRGARVEIHPLNQSQVSSTHQPALGVGHLNALRWERVVAAWAAGDVWELDDAWVDRVIDLGSQWGLLR